MSGALVQRKSAASFLPSVQTDLSPVSAAESQENCNPEEEAVHRSKKSQSLRCFSPDDVTHTCLHNTPARKETRSRTEPAREVLESRSTSDGSVIKNNNKKISLSSAESK